jgi:heptosyltransferase-2
MKDAERMPPYPQERESRILVLRGGAIGDFLLTLPALTAIRRQWPTAYIELMGYPHIAQLSVVGGLANKVVSLNGPTAAQLFCPHPALPAEQIRHIRSFNLIVSYLNDPDEVVKENLIAAGARNVICGCPLVTDSHAIDTLMKPLEQLGIANSGNEYSTLPLSAPNIENGQRRARRLGEHVVAIHPGSGSPRKNWRLGKFLRIAKRLQVELGFTPVITLGEADEAIAAELKNVQDEYTLLPSCSLLELAEFLSACEGYVGNDSGITHLAAALGLPVVALFGPTDPRLWAPRGPNTKILCAPEPTPEALAAIPTDAVWEAITKTASD